ncbi:head-tail adaptor protein [Rhizobium sp. CNPSo 4062]|uniref:head-tail adaptor protein n=1 Tax=Rhizobium sp. CNPSo 4062 TaxID=3021410 RepID=UPI00254CEB9B|nr:head-tail adaptor protein [Rhizobium sp. CNPSo 4062]MDK4704326.1 head-tail adaptor protein [Rhizobium sp. CNPSo 4062]
MAPIRSAGDLFFHVAFDKRADADDGAGNTVGEWQEKLQCRAGFTHLRGGESVMAARLEGQHTQVIFVRRSTLTRGITTDWRVRDLRNGDTFNIRDITPSDDRLWLDFLCQKGVADG